MMVEKTIRFHKRDSAFIYAVFESLEGLCAYSTLEPTEEIKALPYCDLRFLMPQTSANDFAEVINYLALEINFSYPPCHK